MEKDEQKNNKPKRNNNFISAISQGASINSLKNQSLENNEDVNSNQQVNNNENLNTSSFVADSSQDQAKKPKGKNNKEFIENVIKKYEAEADSYKSKEKVTLHTSPQIHSKLKMIAFASGVNLLDLSNAILANFLIDSKEEADALIKKMSL
jgi:hypothetical protein